jgi:DNA-binding GntR family transcriptional regulator
MRIPSAPFSTTPGSALPIKIYKYVVRFFTFMEENRVPRPNLGHIAYQEIKEMILSGALEPGERIILDALSRSLNLSITPIREALSRLEQEDLVVINPRTSHMVVEIDAKEAHDIIDLRLTLELYAIRSAGAALQNFPVDTFRRLFSRPAEPGTHAHFIKTDTEFHSAILATSPNQRLIKLYSYLQNLIQFLSVQAIRAEGRIDEAHEEHLAILNAIESGRIEMIETCLAYHFTMMREALLKVID